MNIDELLKAVNEAGLAPQQLTQVLGVSALLVQREAYRSKEAAIRAEGAKVAQQFEAAAQAEHEKFLAADAALQTP
jgi:hypothetical protein